MCLHILMYRFVPPLSLFNTFFLSNLTLSVKVSPFFWMYNRIPPVDDVNFCSLLSIRRKTVSLSLTTIIIIFFLYYNIVCDVPNIFVNLFIIICLSCTRPSTSFPTFLFTFWIVFLYMCGDPQYTPCDPKYWLLLYCFSMLYTMSIELEMLSELV